MINEILEFSKGLNLNFNQIVIIVCLFLSPSLIPLLLKIVTYITDTIVKLINVKINNKNEAEAHRLENLKQQKIQEKIATQVEQLTLMKEFVKKLDRVITKLDYIENNLIETKAKRRKK